MKTVRIILTAVLASAFVVLTSPSALAAETQSCEFQGYVSFYAHVGDDDLPTGSGHSFAEYYCESEGLPIYVSKANTRSEVRTLHAVARNARSSVESLTIFCQTSPTNARMVDHLWHYATGPAKPGPAYNRWARAYAKSHGCDVYRKA